MKTEKSSLLQRRSERAQSCFFRMEIARQKEANCEKCKRIIFSLLRQLFLNGLKKILGKNIQAHLFLSVINNNFIISILLLLK